MPYSVEGFRVEARRRLPKAVFDFIDGGANDEHTMRRNREAFQALDFMPNVLLNVRDCTLDTTVCGIPMRSPIMLAPTGLVGMVHPDGELGGVTAAARHGVIAVVSSAATYSIEELVAAVPEQPPWFQLYPYKDRGFYGAIVDRVAEAGYGGLCLTVDAAVAGKRERDLANGLTVRPLRITRSNAFQAVSHPRWLLGVVNHRRIIAKLSVEESSRARPPLRSLLGRASASAAGLVELLPREAAWEDLEWLRERWSGPLAVKGVLNPADATRVADLGADAVIVSNHGGRQLDGVPGAFAALPGVVDATADRLDVILDGGIRRGSDIAKALCLGAKACMIGRPWLYGLATAGTGGVEAVLVVLESELRTTLALLGQRDVARLNSTYLVPAKT